MLRRSSGGLDVLNEARVEYSIPVTRVTYHVEGLYAFGDLISLSELLAEMKPQMIEPAWEAAYTARHAYPNGLPLRNVTLLLFGTEDPLRYILTWPSMIHVSR